MSWDSVVSTVWPVQSENHDLIPSWGKTIFLFSRACMPALGPTQPPTQWLVGLFPGVEHSGCQVDHSPPSSTEVRSEWNNTSNPPFLCGVHTSFYMYLTC